jgi:GTP pyrophosphokinase
MWSAWSPAARAAIAGPGGDEVDGRFEQTLAGITLAPYIMKATALIGVQRRNGSNMFRHQLSTMAILLDYKILDPVLLKAACIHDLFEDAANMPGVTERDISGLDSDGPAVFELVTEVTVRVIDGVKEPKNVYLPRVMQHGSQRARLLKLADRISNMTALGFVHDAAFVRRYLDETAAWVLPYAAAVNADMSRELTDLVESRERLLPALTPRAATR